MGGLLRWFFYARIVGLWLLVGFVLFGLLHVPIFIGEVLSSSSLPGYGFICYRAQDHKLPECSPRLEFCARDGSSLFYLEAH